MQRSPQKGYHLFSALGAAACRQVGHRGEAIWPYVALTLRNMRFLSLLALGFALVGCRDQGTKRKDEPLPVRTPMCGDGILDPGESCDGSELGMATCQGLGFDTGSLSCASDCSFATSLCVKRCGNGVIDLGEACDGTLGLSTCTDFGYISCTDTCTVDSLHCIRDPLTDGPSLTLDKGGPTALGDLSPPGPGDLVMAVPAMARIETFPWSLQTGFTQTGSRKLSFFRAPQAVAVADLSGSSANDVIALNGDGTVDLYEFNGNGFTPRTLDAGCLDGGFAGAMHVTGTSTNNAVLMQCGTDGLLFSGTTVQRIQALDGVVARSDVNADGLTDLLKISGAAPATISVLTAPQFSADGGSTLTGTPLSAAAGDLDNDGDMDLVTTTTTGLTLYEFASGAWSEKALVIAANTADLQIADVDLDGLNDLFYTSGDLVVMRRNRGNFVFSEFSRTAGTGTRLSTSLGDVDGDGDLDVAVTIKTGTDSTQTRIIINRLR